MGHAIPLLICLHAAEFDFSGYSHMMIYHNDDLTSSTVAVKASYFVMLNIVRFIANHMKSCGFFSACRT